MKKIMKIAVVMVMVIAMTVMASSCDFREVLDKIGIENNNEGGNRENRISASLSRAKDAQISYNANRALAGLEAQPDGTIYVVENNGYYVRFEIQSGYLEDINPEELPQENPLKGNDDYKKVKGDMRDKIPELVQIYIPKGAE